MIATVTNAPQVRQPHHSLIEVANVITGGSNRWENGITFTPTNCDPGRILAQGCPSPIAPDAIECTEPVVFKPFVLEATYAWSTLDLAADPKSIAINTLETATTRLVERAFWTGETLDPTDPMSTTTHTDIHALTGATEIAPAGPAVAALGQVLKALADSSTGLGASATVHMNAAVATHLTAGAMLTHGPNDGLYTIAGMCPVVVGDYPEDAIVGHTGDIDLFLGETFVVEHTERAKNERVVMVERLALVAYNNCTAVKAPVSFD